MTYHVNPPTTAPHTGGDEAWCTTRLMVIVVFLSGVVTVDTVSDTAGEFACGVLRRLEHPSPSYWAGVVADAATGVGGIFMASRMLIGLPTWRR